jgi:hypothetical protein
MKKLGSRDTVYILDQQLLTQVQEKELKDVQGNVKATTWAPSYIVV